MNLMNSKFKMNCTICSASINEKVWVCMNQSCNKNIDYYTSDSSMNNFCALICENHIGTNQLSQDSAHCHKIVCMFKGKVQNSMTGTSELWIPKNLFRNHPHLIEKRLYLQKQIMNKVNNEDFAKLAINKWKDLSNRQSEQGSIFDNIRLLDEISVGCKSNDEDIASFYKHPAPGYEHLNNFHDSLAAIHFESNENTSFNGFNESKRSLIEEYSNKSILPEEDQDELDEDNDNLIPDNENMIAENENLAEDNSLDCSGNQDKEDILNDEDFEIELDF